MSWNLDHTEKYLVEDDNNGGGARGESGRESVHSAEEGFGQEDFGSEHLK